MIKELLIYNVNTSLLSFEGVFDVWDWSVRCPRLRALEGIKCSMLCVYNACVYITGTTSISARLSNRLKFQFLMASLVIYGLVTR